ncbi:LOW QUALITY PROTEIN: uncharacterized protein LOC129229731 [Uloborus diversus]|uniref:LOW QUALITY PROTEIN: uncharacterized protein LOC129229731 n=1 Tax=Uloborus diversus TaxID=327109 RepID=UPI0024099C94|nr:LOW QUALITY PROTEIN: uncharacterized protein LOC129229731 [Uloborus diversus]
MKLLVATALLLCVAADAYHTSQHKLLGPMFQVGKIHYYNLTMDISAGIAGISAQTARSRLNAELAISAKSQKDHVLKLTNVRVSGSQKSVPSYSTYLPLQPDSTLESHLSLPVTFTLEKGQVTSYRMSNDETLETRKIKKSILRMIEMYVDESSVKQMETRNIGEIPVTYNLTRKSPSGEYQSHYIITASPYPNFPMETNVYNISRSDNYENIRYPGHKFHHNLKQQGCAEVCRKDWKDNKYGAGCPSGSEPHQSPVKLYYTHHHHLAAKRGVMVPEIIEVTETHVANYYDQDMKIFIRSYMRHKTVTDRGSLPEPKSEMQIYTDLEDYEQEINKGEINNFCQYESPRLAIDVAKKLINELTDIVLKGDLQDTRSSFIGEKLVLLQKALQKISENDIEKIESDIPKLGTLTQASDKDRIKRQIWTNILSVVGSKQSVSYIASYIQRNVGRDLTVWESKEILESLPENIHEPSEQNIRDLKKLWEVSKVKEHHILHSAAYLTVSRVIKSLCEEELTNSEDQASSWMSDYYQVLRNFRLAQSSEATSSVKCPKSLVSEIVQNIIQKWESTESKQEKAVYIQALAHISTPEALRQLAKYALGIADDIQKYTPSQATFFRTLTLSTLHRAAKKNPQAVLSIVAPIYFNKTEEPKLRAAAFSILLRSQPSRELLEHVAHDTWYETSKEVGSYVTSSLEYLGNSTLPCDQLVAQRIKMVISQAKRFDIGIHHAKSYRSSYYDDSRFFAGEGKFEYTPSNESIIPSNIYHSHTYSVSNLKGIFLQNGVNIQGLTHEIIENYLETFGLRIGRPISPSKESDLFKELQLENIVPEKFRMTLKHRLFYQSSFYYIQNIMKDIAPLKEHIDKYFRASGNNFKGTWLKMMIPSAMHTISIAKTIPFPVETEMRHPILVAISIENQKRSRKLELRTMHILVRFSVYGTRMLTSQILALRDCKDVGTYYEEKFAATIPVELEVDVEQWNRISVEYTIKQLPKKVLCLRAEAGTYAGKKSLESLPHMSERDPIQTVPSPFKHEQKLNIVGLPPIHVNAYTENILEFRDIPTTVQETQEWVTKKLMNAGWRQRSVNITMNTDSTYWPANNKVSFKLNYDQENVFPGQSNMYQSQAHQYREHQHQATGSDETEDDIVKEMKFDEKVSPGKSGDFVVTAKKIYHKLISRYPHMRHIVDLQVLSSTGSNKAVIKAVYNHTMGRHLHSFHVDAKVNLKRLPTPIEISADHLMGFHNRLNEFNFDRKSYKNQIGLFLSTLSQHHAEPYDNVDIVAHGSMQRIPGSKILNDLLVNKLDEEEFLPEDYEVCERHTREGKGLSQECQRSIRELSHYNKYKVQATWTEGKLPAFVKTIAKRIEWITRVVALGKVEVTDKPETPREQSINLDVTYIDKLTDEPLIDIVLEKPKEIVKYHKIKAGFIQPLSSIDNVLDSYILAATNNSYPATCHVMQKYWTTYDHVTHLLPTNKCQYLISAHCAEHKKFVVFGKTLDSRENTKEITLHVGEHTLVLSPKRALTYEVKFNGQKKTIHPLKPQQLGDEEVQLLVVMNTAVQGSFLEVYYPYISLKLTYDGKNVKIQVPPTFKGELCGLCSSFDGEVTRELFAADQCLYSRLDDFIKRAIVNPRECEQSIDPAAEPLCYSKTGSRMHSDTVETRNIVQYKGDQICFSILPIGKCLSGGQPKVADEVEIGFHCLPRRDSTARRLAEEAKTRVLDVMRSKSVDYTETVISARKC